MNMDIDTVNASIMSDTKPPSSGGISGPLSSMNIPCFASAVPVVYHNHPGYVSYLDHIERTVPLYNASKPNQKWHVIRSIITELQKDGLEFVFLNRDGTWSDYDDDHAHSRATNLMRQFIRYHEDGVPIGEKDIPIFASSVPATLHNHPGYVSYLDLVQSYVTEYITAKPNHKIVILRNVLDKINERDMKFVRFDTSLNTWVDYDDNDLVIKEKIRTLIKMFSKISVDDESRNHVNNSTLNDSTITITEGSNNEYDKSGIYTPVTASRKIKIPIAISHNSNDEQDSDTSDSSDTNTVNSDEDEDGDEDEFKNLVTQPANLPRKRYVSLCPL